MRLQSYKINLIELEIVLLAMLSISPGYIEILNLQIGTILVILIDIFGIILLCKGRKGTNFAMHSIPFFLWSIYAIIHFIAAGSFVDAFLFFSKTFILYFILDYILTSKKNMQTLFDAIEIASIFACCIGIIEEFFHTNLFALIGGTDISELYNSARFGMTRVMSFTSQTINFGCYLFLMTGVSVFCINSKYTKRRMYSIAYLLQWVNLFFTMSRSVIIIGLCANFVLNYILGKKKLILKVTKYICIFTIPVVVIFVLFPTALKTVINVFYMLIAVFDSDFISKFASSYGAENINAFGERKQLFSWVCNSMNANWLFGNGIKSEFNYFYQYNIGVWTVDAVKNSIENQYLYVLYQKGIIGLILEIFLYFSVLSVSFKRIKKPHLDKKNNYYICVFCKCVFVTLLFYMILVLGVSRQSEENLFIILITSFLIMTSKQKIYKG